MKKKIATLVLFLCAITLNAQNYTRSQEALRSEISSYLSREGFNPERQSDGVKFKSEGISYYVEIDKTENDPMYLRMCRYLKYDDHVSRESVMSNLNSFNAKYAVKVSCQDKYILISSEMFLTEASEFIYAFNDLFKQVKSAVETIID